MVKNIQISICYHILLMCHGPLDREQFVKICKKGFMADWFPDIYIYTLITKRYIQQLGFRIYIFVYCAILTADLSVGKSRS